MTKTKALSLHEADLTGAIENAATLAGDRISDLAANDVDGVTGGGTLDDLIDIILGLVLNDPK